MSAAALLSVAWLALEWALLPDVGSVAVTSPRSTAFTRWTAAREQRSIEVEWVPYAEIATSLKLAVVVAEDINFFAHDGFDREQMRIALREAVDQRRMPRGASTISQQLVKNLWLSPSRSPRRKVREAVLTRRLEARLDKRRILELYLNVVDFGDGTFGCGPAARRFFGRRPAALGRRQAARMAAVLPRPSRWRPDGDDARFLAAVDRIERRMARADWVRGSL